MKKFLAAVGVMFAVALMSFGFAGTAQAYPDVTPPTDTTPSTGSGTLGSGASAGTGSGVLPSTGGPETLLLVGGVALLAVGGATVVGARRRTAAA
ncbi:LPXTG-motif cell wall anchor domain-containing protein [Nocardioides scoriae]|uniref:LPXTG-motif cell wall anchor domain-containing protein n=1 Tax=Nocardioides scoriae TaxID=642780 RepID=A0A1H1W233_9ACTN|nr:LPXTG cell wall anchor domain-containing protein [Nocardioides scoriae]SDS91113.1 LPXTG-motif cell wall anchor domain-containing protein [Nocardioides scoriae]